MMKTIIRYLIILTKEHNMQKLIVTIMSIVFVLAMSSPVMSKMSQGKMRGNAFGKMCGNRSTMKGLEIPHGKWWKNPKTAKDLELTEEEQDKLDSLFLEFRKSKIDLNANYKKEKLDLEPLIESENLDKGKCLNQFKKVLKAQENLSLNKFEFLFEIRYLLGTKQYMKLKTGFRQKLKQKKNKKHKMGGVSKM